jgi:5-methylcytosine-specific restriction endonuclease McrA
MLFGDLEAPLGTREPDNWATIEHLTPKSQGGTDDLANLVLACKLCNSSRGNRPAVPA